MRSRFALLSIDHFVQFFTMSTSRWTPDQAWIWYRKQAWLVGCNFLPSSAINQLEMFQADDYERHRETLVRELDWAAKLGMNTLRIFLHDLLWGADAAGFCRRLDDFLDLCAARGIRPMIVFFDACHRPEPRIGRQPAPTPGIHNPGWAQSPSVSALMDDAEWPRLERYVTGVLARYGADDRILCWDLYNEPCNGGFDGNETKQPASARLVTEVFAWARAAAPMHPLTVCTWTPELNPVSGHDEDALPLPQRELLRAQRAAVALSDVISFHDYNPASKVRDQIERLATLGRPLLCTEYLARTIGSLFSECLPLFREHSIAAYNWGFVAGKSQTYQPWNTPADSPEPNPWFHDILRPDGTPFDADETRLIRELTGRGER